MTARRVATVLVVAWALLFVAGSLGEVFAIESLQRATDLKRVFLR